MSNTPDGFTNDSGFRGRFDQTPRQRYVLSSSVILTAVLCLVFVIVLITILHLYARYMLRRQQAQRRRSQAHFDRSAHAPGTIDHQLQRPKTGLDPAVVASLPKFAYKKEGQDQPEAAADECSVCLSKLEEGETVRRLPACGHMFHDTCIDMWLFSHNTCPLCRKVVGPIAPPTAVPSPAPATVDVVVVIDVGGAGNHSSPRPVVAEATFSQLLMPTAAAACGGSGSGSGQGDSGHEEVSGAPSRLASFRRMFSLERRGVRRQQPGDEGAHRDRESL